MGRENRTCLHYQRICDVLEVELIAWTYGHVIHVVETVPAGFSFVRIRNGLFPYLGEKVEGEEIYGGWLVALLLGVRNSWCQKGAALC